MSNLTSGMGQIVGLQPYCDWLNALGHPAEVAAPKDIEGLPAGVFARDQHTLRLSGSPVAFVSLRWQGAMGPRQMMGNGAFNMSVGGLPLAGRTAIPIQAHWCVRSAAPKGQQAALKQQIKGWFKRERVGFTWTGALADKLNADAELMAMLEVLTVDDSLKIEPDASLGLVRIVHQRPIVFAYGLATPKLLELMRGQVHDSVPTIFERIARHLS